MRSMIVGFGLLFFPVAGFASDNTGTDASTGAPDGQTGATSAAPLPVTPASTSGQDEDGVEKELERQTRVAQKRVALLEEQKKLQAAQLEVVRAEYPVATITDLKKGDTTTYEQTSFLANWALSANLERLVPPASDISRYCEGKGPTLVAGDDTNYASKLLAARMIDETIKALLEQADTWNDAAIADAKKAAGRAAKKDGNGAGKGEVNRESGAIKGFAIAQSLATQTLDLIKYFRTDIEFKAATVSLPTQTLRSAVAQHCPNSRLPELSVPTKGDLLTNYAKLTTLAESIRARTREDSSAGMLATLKAEGLSLVASIDAIKAQAVPTGQSQVSPIVEAAQILGHSDIKQILSVRINDQGATVYKRSNLFFLSPKVSYVAAIGVNYVISDVSTGTVRWQKTMLLKTQLNQKFSRWSPEASGIDATSSGQTTGRLQRTTTVLE